MSVVSCLEIPSGWGKGQRTTDNGRRASFACGSWANPNAPVRGLDQLPGKSNYFIGSDPNKWRIDVPTYAKVKYDNVYPGVDLVYYGNQRQLEYDFVVAPGVDPGVIVLELASGESKIQNPKPESTATAIWR